MMRRTIHMVVVMLGYLLCTAKSCVPEADPGQELSYEDRHAIILQEVRDGFASDYVTERRLRVFEESARLKLYDLADYLNLYTNRHIDTVFRHQVRSVIGRLFYTEEDAIRFFQTNTPEFQVDLSSLTGFSDYWMRSGYESLHFGIEGDSMVNPLEPDGDGRYSGELGCVVHLSGISNTDTALISRHAIRVKIIVARTRKSFGDNNPMTVWQVFLSSLEE